MAEIKEKKNRKGQITGYFVRVNLGRDEEGKKIRASTTLPYPTGKDGKPLTPKRAEKEIQRQAENWEREQKKAFDKEREDITQAKITEKSNITLPEFIDNHWLPDHVNDAEHTPKTKDFYRFISAEIKDFFNNDYPKTKLVDIDVIEIRAFLFYLKTDAKRKDGQPLSKTTIQHYFNALRNIMNFAVYEGFLPENPCLRIKPKDRPKKESREIDFLQPEEAVRFIECLDSEKEAEWWERYHHRSPLMWKCLCNILITTGLRRGEAIGLQWCDLDANMVIHVQRNVTTDTSQKESDNPYDKISIGQTKTKATRTEHITAYLFELLMQYKEEQETRHNIKFMETEGKPVNSTAYIFCHEMDLNLPLYPTNITRLMQKYIKRHSLPNVSPHDLRRTAASLAVEAGANVKQIQALMGHKDASTTLKFYAGLSKHAAKQTAEGIEEILRPKATVEQESKNG